MLVSDNNNNRGAHGASSFMLGGMPSSSENPPASAVGSVKKLHIYHHTVGLADQYFLAFGLRVLFELPKWFARWLLKGNNKHGKRIEKA